MARSIAVPLPRQAAQKTMRSKQKLRFHDSCRRQLRNAGQLERDTGSSLPPTKAQKAWKKLTRRTRSSLRQAAQKTPGLRRMGPDAVHCAPGSSESIAEDTCVAGVHCRARQLRKEMRGSNRRMVTLRSTARQAAQKTSPDTCAFAVRSLPRQAAQKWRARRIEWTVHCHAGSSKEAARR